MAQGSALTKRTVQGRPDLSIFAWLISGVVPLSQLPTLSTVGSVTAAFTKNLLNPADAGVVLGSILSGGSATTNASYNISGYIPVAASTQYTISGTGPRNVAFYNSSKTYISPQTDNPTNATLTVTTPATAAYLRISLNAGVSPFTTAQVELGASATSYVSYGFALPGQIIGQRATADLADAAVTPVKTSFIAATKNLYNPADADVKVGFVLSGGSPSANSTYTTTGFIPVTAGAQYTLSNPRSWAFYNASKTYVAASQTLNPSNPNAATVTVPGGAAYMRASFVTASYTTNFQVEAGAVATAYVPWGFQIANLYVPTSGGGGSTYTAPLTVVKAGETFTISHKFNNGVNTLSLITSRSGSSNGGFNFVSTSQDGTTIHANSDDVCPIRTFNTLGANHGYTCIGEFTNPDSKTTADFGSQWQDTAGRRYVLLGIDATTSLLQMGGDYTTDGSGVISSTNVAPTTDLTHVSGATHTGTIDHTTLVSGNELLPSVKAMAVTYLLDGVPVTVDGTYTGRVLDVVESYQILDYASLYDTAKANVGTSYTSLTVAGLVRIGNQYRFTPDGVCLVAWSVTALKPVTFGACGAVQTFPIGKAGTTLTRYMPRVMVKGGFDFAAGVDMTSYATSLIYTTSDLVTAGKPPTHITDWLTDTTTHAKVIGFTMGYIPDVADASDANRITNAATDLWDMRSTKKSYPTVFTGLTLTAGQRKTAIAYRAYLPASCPVTDAAIIPAGAATYAFIDVNSSVTAQPIPAVAQIGKTIATVDAGGLTIGSSVVDGEGISVTGTGAATLKLT